MGEYNDILSLRRGKGVISVAEMAQRYFPKETDKEKVRRMFTKMLKKNPELMEELAALHFNLHEHTLTPNQQRAIIKYIGEP